VDHAVRGAGRIRSDDLDLASGRVLERRRAPEAAASTQLRRGRGRVVEQARRQAPWARRESRIKPGPPLRVGCAVVSVRMSMRFAVLRGFAANRGPVEQRAAIAMPVRHWPLPL